MAVEKSVYRRKKEKNTINYNIVACNIFFYDRPYDFRGGV